MRKNLLIVTLVLICISSLMELKSQNLVKVPVPEGTLIYYSSPKFTPGVQTTTPNARAFGNGGLITYYYNTTWPGSPRDTGCLYWGVDETLIGVINGNNTLPPDNACSNMSNLSLTLDASKTNLNAGQICFTGYTPITFIYNSAYLTYSFPVYQYIIIRKKSDGSVIPLFRLNGKVIAKVPDADFFVTTNIQITYTYYNVASTDASNPVVYQNNTYYALDLYDKLHTYQYYSMCTNWDGGDFYRIKYSADFQVTDATCYGFDNGAVNLTVNGGVSPFQYAWNTPNPSSEDQLDLLAGNYTVNISDAAKCMITRDVTLSQPDSIRANLVITDVTCAGYENGSVMASPSGGTGALSLEWDNASSENFLSNLPPGKYGLLISDEANCQLADTAEIKEPLPLAYTLTLDNPSCYSSTNGSAKVNVTGGTTPYKFLWASGDTTDLREGLAAGTYGLTITDANLCNKEVLAELVQPDSLNVDATLTPVSCFKLEDGAISLAVTGGSGPYMINWSNGSTGKDISGLAAGDYAATITDTNACELKKNLTIIQPDSLIAQLTKTDISCAGKGDGSITAVPAGGSSPYTFTWDKGGDQNAVTGLEAGYYSVTIADKNNCQVTDSLLINEPPALDVLLELTSPVCSYGTDGEISAVVNGGVGPYHYTWSTGDTAEILEMISAGEYSLTLLDFNDCSIEVDTTLLSLSNLKVQSSLSPVSCNGMEDGSVTLEISGGEEPYDLLWTGGNTSTTRSGLAGGVYPFRVYDNYLCAVRDTVTMVEPATLLAVATPVSPSCFGGTNGAVNLSVSGGTEPYSFLWNTGAETPVISALAAGNYDVTVTDAHDCVSQDSAEVTNPPADFVSFSAQTDNGEATFTNSSTDGTYEWNFGDDQGSMDANPVHKYKSNGTYSVCLTLTTSCSTLQSCQDVVIDGITIVKKTASGISLYPNPVKNVVNLSWKGSEIPVQFYIYDAMGRMVLNRNIHSGESMEVDVSGLGQGIYHVKFMFDGYYETVPMIINR